MIIMQKRFALYSELVATVSIGMVCYIMIMILINAPNEKSLEVLFYLALFVLLLSLIIVQLFRSVRRIELHGDTVHLIYWMRTRRRIKIDSISGYSACSWKLSPLRGQGIIVYEKTISHEIFDYQMDGLFVFIDLLKDNRVKYLGEEYVWYPYVFSSHKFSVLAR
jgi:uncharacterized membrane protein